jgi:thiol-disulfide isomerase/thioredoxin
MDGAYQPGMYRLEVNRNQGLDVIFNNESVSISVNRYFWLDSIKVHRSLENKVFYNYVATKNSYGNRLSLLEPVVMYYPPDDEFYGVAEKEYLKLEEEYSAYIDSVSQIEGISVAPVIIRWDQLPDLEVREMDPDLRDFYKKHYFDNVSSNDTVMIRTPVLPVKIIDYLSLFVLPGTSRESQEQEFIAGVDAIMEWCSGNNSMQEVVINYLIDGFQMYGFERVMTHLVENYVLDNTCVSDQEQEKLKFRIEGFRKMAKGKKVPDFELKDTEGVPLRLSALEKDYALIVFWSSWCPHCADMMPGLNELYDVYGSNVEFVGVSVDNDRGDWLKALEEKQVDWPNVAELRGWDGKTATEYYVYATPTLFLVNNELEIVAKPGSLDELTEELEKLE